jgi:hypothetical protein
MPTYAVRSGGKAWVNSPGNALRCFLLRCAGGVQRKIFLPIRYLWEEKPSCGVSPIIGNSPPDASHCAFRRRRAATGKRAGLWVLGRRVT